MFFQELNKCKTELQYWRSRSPAVPPLCAECGAALHLSPAAPLAQVHSVRDIKELYFFMIGMKASDLDVFFLLKNTSIKQLQQMVIYIILVL